MKFLKDFKEAQELWRSSSILTKILLATSVVLASGSLASLSDTVFKWKRFILEAVSFYQEWVRGPVINFASYLQLNFSPTEADVFAVYSTVFAVPWREREGEGVSPRVTQAVGFLLLVLYFGLLRNPTLEKGNLDREGWHLLFLPLFYGLFLWFQYPESRVRLLGPMITPWLVVGLLAAINSGLTR